MKQAPFLFQAVADVVGVATPNRVPVGWLKLKPNEPVPSARAFLAVVCGATEALRRRNVRLQDAILGRWIEFSEIGTRIFASQGVIVSPKMSFIPRPGSGKPILKVIHIHHHSDSNLPQVIETLRKTSLLFRPSQPRKKQAGQDANDSDDHKELDKSERS